MVPVTYINMYIFVILGFIGSTLFGAYFFYSGMETTSFIVATNSGTATYYFDKDKYDLFFQGFIYSTTFFIAGILLITVMAIPSESILQNRAAAAQRLGVQYGASQAQTVATPQMAPPQMVAPQTMPPPQQMAAPQTMPPPQQMAAPTAEPAKPMSAPKSGTPDINLEEEDELDDFDDVRGEERAEDTGDNDVIYGMGRITEESTVDFIHKYPDSAIKFLYRKTLDGKPLPSNEEEIYEGWQQRGLGRKRVRDYVLQIMEWETLPDQTLMETWSQLRDQIFELTH